MKPVRSASRPIAAAAASLCVAITSAWLAAFSLPAAAQQDFSQFPAAAVRFLDAELPGMEAAVAARDRGYFEEAMARTMVFSDDWGFKSRANEALSGYRMCTDAVSDAVIVHLCRLLPPSDECEPMLPVRFNTNLQQCRSAAGR